LEFLCENNSIFRPDVEFEVTASYRPSDAHDVTYGWFGMSFNFCASIERTPRHAGNLNLYKWCLKSIVVATTVW